MKVSKLALLTVLAVSVTGAAFAAPQTTFEKGQTQVDAGAIWSKSEVSDYTSKNKTGFVGGITHAFNDKTAIQYGYTGFGGKADPSILNNATDAKVDADVHEINLVRSLNKNFALYGGYERINVKETVNYPPALGISSTEKDHQNVAHIGLIAKAQLGNKVEVYAKGAVGTKKTTEWEAGAAYKINDNLDLNAGYKYLNTEAAVDSVTFKGFTTGLSYRFGGSSKVETPAPVVVPARPAQPVYVAPQPVVEHKKNDYYVQSIHFGFDEATPLASQQPNLDLLVSTAKAHPENTFKLVGNTDSIGNYEYNQKLSEERVNNVLNYVVSQGLPASQFKTLYKGYNNPASTNDTAQGRADNRRVDVYINK